MFQNQALDPFDLVIFGGTGDLSRRKLFPALYHRARDGRFTPQTRIIAVSRREKSQEALKDFVHDALRENVKEQDWDEATWTQLATQLSYCQVDGTSPTGWGDLKNMLKKQQDRVRIFYLATTPTIFGAICENLAKQAVINDHTRVVLEKPIGTDLATARAINDRVAPIFQEEDIYRIDHYLGKESVQNLLALRFGNALFEPLWKTGSIDSVQITVSETLGVGSRAGYYDRTGALRDMMQNHLLQLLCLVAMEPPTCLGQNEVRAEKIKVLKALRPIGEGDVQAKTVLGQYRDGAVKGRAVVGYRDEQDVAEGSTTETFVAIKAEIDNWRWAHVPFYLRTGKRLAARCSEIVIQFRGAPHSIFGPSAGKLKPNQLIIRLQPDEGVKLTMMTKVPGPGGIKLKSVPLNLSFAEAFQTRAALAYERLLSEVVRGNSALFMHRDEVEAAWLWIDTILNGWQRAELEPQSYMAGSWGPVGAQLLLDRDGRAWHNIDP